MARMRSEAQRGHVHLSEAKREHAAQQMEMEEGSPKAAVAVAGLAGGELTSSVLLTHHTSALSGSEASSRQQSLQRTATGGQPPGWLVGWAPGQRMTKWGQPPGWLDVWAVGQS